MAGEIQIPGESKDRIVKEAHKRSEVYEAEGVPTEQALTELVAWLMEQDEVEETKALYKTDLTVRFVDGTQIGILLGRRQAYGLLAGPQGAKGGDAAKKPDCEQ